MQSFLPPNIKEDFYIRLIFNIKDGYHYAGIRKAYLDFCRTLKITDKPSHPSKKEECEYILMRNLCFTISQNYMDQKAFDHQHQILCDLLISAWGTLTYGQAQKWINMTLKYWLLLGENKIENINKNARFFHIPIDSFVQKKMFCQKNPSPWSKINSYDEYFKYQISYRQELSGDNPPIIEEFIFFNTTT